jgi:hypothetical protein
MTFTNANNPQADRSPFLELPGELRNTIYSYALSEPAGLRFRQDDYCIGRLESMDSPVPPRQLVSIMTCKTEAMVRKDVARNASRVANQLQYVNKELRRETRGLGIRYNDLFFEQLHDALLFIDICPQEVIQYLGTLKLIKGLYTTHGDPSDSLLDTHQEKHMRLFQFCIANPSITLHNTVTGWKHTDPLFVPYAILVRMQFRKCSSCIADFFTDPTTRSRVLSVTSRKVAHITHTLPENLKFFPEDEAFDEEVFRAACTGEKLICDLLDHAVEGGVERWVPLVRKIYEEGV